MHSDTAEFDESYRNSNVGDEEIPEELEIEIENLLWEYAPGELTIAEAKDLSWKICKMIYDGKLY